MTEETPKTESACLCAGIGPTLTKLVQTLAPPEAAGEHFRRARIEMLKGLRELLDHRIETLSQTPETHGTKLTVE
ncbi:MAG: hypothetical protein J0L64_15470 [Acidobacteria bacterium]|nr:hypothetical protein [Acidobacteriota bacterium]